MAFIQKPINKLTKDELVENLKVLEAGEDFPNKEQITDISKLIEFHKDELKERFNYDYDARNEAKIKSWIDNIFEWGDKGASIVNKFKGGVEANIEGDKFDVSFGDDEIENKNKKVVRNVIIGVTSISIIIIAILIFMKNANKKK